MAESDPAIAAALARIREIVGPRGWIDTGPELEPYLVEQRGLFRGRTAAVVRPATTEEVSAVIAAAAAADIAIVPQGGNTGLCGGGVPPEDRVNIVVALGRMNRVRAIDAVNFTMIAEAGCILSELHAAAAAADRLFPLSLGAEGSCQIGGNIATNAGGIQVLRYGNARDLVLGLEVVLPDGRVWDGLRCLRKDNTGYDLKQVFIGSEGTLGIITATCLRLFPRPRATATALLGLADVDRVMALFAQARAASGDQMTAFELMCRPGIDLALRHVPGIVDPLSAPYPAYALIEVSSPAEQASVGALLEALLVDALEKGLVEDGTIAASGAQVQALWRLREAIVEAQRLEGGSIKHDISVPVSAVAEFIARATAAVEARLPGVRPIAFGHVGDGNVHFNLTQPLAMDRDVFLARWVEFNEIVHGVAAALGGSISAEHGIGRLKRDELTHYKQPLEMELMARLKSAFDPRGLMNPGKVVQAPGARDGP